MKTTSVCRIILAYIVIASFQCQAQPSAQSVEELYVKAITAQKNLESSDSSGVERLLGAILAQDPTHPRALWQLTFRRFGLFDDDGVTLSQYAAKLAAAAPVIQTIADDARQRGDQAFAHYVLGRYAGLYNAFDRALVEMNKALALKPDSIRYRMIKGLILIDKGEWENDDAPILQGMQLIEEARLMSDTSPSLFYNTADYYFKLAYSNAKLESEDPQKTIDYYLSFIQHAVNKRSIAFAWNNLSGAYRQAGDCGKALESADHALTLSDFGAARTNRRYAQFCKEMKAMGISMPVASHQN